MYFIFEIEFSSNINYIAELIRAYAKQEKIEVDVLQTIHRRTQKYSSTRIQSFLSQASVFYSLHKYKTIRTESP